MANVRSAGPICVNRYQMWRLRRENSAEAGGRTREVHRRLDRGNGTEEYSDASLTAGCGAENRGGAQVAEGTLLIRIELDA